MKNICWECVVAIVCAAIVIGGLIILGMDNSNKYWSAEYKMRNECIAKNGTLITGDRTHCIISREVK